MYIHKRNLTPSLILNGPMDKVSQNHLGSPHGMLAGHLNSYYVHYVCGISLDLLPKLIYPGESQARPMNKVT